MKNVLLALLFCLIQNAYGQKERHVHFLGINPSVTVEPYYESGELDINVFPLVYQRSFSKRLDFRLTSILNYGVRKEADRLSHFGLELGLPVFIQKKENKGEPSEGFFIAPILSLTRNNEEKHTNVGTHIEPGYNFLFENNFALSLGIHLGATFFINDNASNYWGEHFGVKVIFGKWF